MSRLPPPPPTPNRPVVTSPTNSGNSNNTNNMTNSSNNLGTTTTDAGVESSSSVVPTLRVMRLQSPELHEPSSSVVSSSACCSIHNALCLPDSLQVMVGETFTAYLGVLNVSRSIPIRRLTVQAHLQTPSHRWQLPSPLSGGSGNEAGGGAGVDIPVGSLVDAIVSHAIEEAGQHILRVEVSYAGDGGMKTFRKFYRFQVVNPLTISTVVVRMGDCSCLVQVSVEYNPEAASVGAGGAGIEQDSIVIAHAAFVPAPGLVAERITSPTTTTTTTTTTTAVSAMTTATDLLDKSGLLGPKQSRLYLFTVSSSETAGKGLTVGEKLGSALFTWRKSMGETGRVYSSAVVVPPVLPRFTAAAAIAADSDSVLPMAVYQSGLSMDVAAAADRRTSIHQKLPLGVTVEPAMPVLPQKLYLNQPVAVDLLICNHEEHAMVLQLQFRLANMTELAICGPSFISLGTVEGRGGSTITTIRLIPLATGLLTLQGCWIVDLASDHEIPQPPLFHVYCDLPTFLDTTSIHASKSRLIEYVVTTKKKEKEEERDIQSSSITTTTTNHTGGVLLDDMEAVQENARHKKVWEEAQLRPPKQNNDVFAEELP